MRPLYWPWSKSVRMLSTFTSPITAVRIAGTAAGEQKSRLWCSGAARVERWPLRQPIHCITTGKLGFGVEL
jgi:hypothetical protein